jgi:hypothetical protein
MWSPPETFEYDTKVKDFNVKTMRAKNQSFRQLNVNLEWSAALRKKHWPINCPSKKKYRDSFRYVSLR